MKKINPLGRVLEDSTDAQMDARACQCSTWDDYVGARGRTDDCEHCGCQCDQLIHNVANRGAAEHTERAS